MNKAEIIRRISKKAGVPDTEAKIFFEIFLKNASELLKPGESLKIEEVGLFQLRVGQIEKSDAQNPGDQFIYSDLIVFLNEEGEIPKDEEEIIFNVPSGIEDAYQPIDSYFSLSIGKPVIPLKGLRESEFFIPPSGTELRSLLESKIERLIQEAEKTEGGKETETIHLRNEEDIEEPFDWKKLGVGNNPEDSRVPERSDFLKTREFENLSWDFGENLSQEIEEEAILDFDKEEDIKEKKEELPVEAREIQSGEQAEEKPLFEEEKEDEETQDEDIFEEIIDDETADEDIYEEEATGRTEEHPESGSLRNDGIEDQETGDKIFDEEIGEHPAAMESEKAEPENETTVPVLKNFQRVTSLTKEFNTSAFEENEEPEKEKPRKVTEVRGGYQKVRRTTAEFDFDLSNIKGLDEIEEPEPKEKKSRRRDYQGYRKRSSLPSFIIAFIVVLAMAGVIFLYLKLKNANDNLAGKSQSAGEQTKVIERNYDIPVTYPYKTGDQKERQAQENTREKSTEDNTAINPPTTANTTKPDMPDIRKPVNAERIGNYIYRYPEGIVVQVSSWKSKTIALSEVSRYRKKGYTAFAEISDIPGMGLYYRVRVGYFNSLEQAENFANTNQ